MQAASHPLAREQIAMDSVLSRTARLEHSLRIQRAMRNSFPFQETRNPTFLITPKAILYKPECYIQALPTSICQCGNSACCEDQDSWILRAIVLKTPLFGIFRAEDTKDNIVNLPHAVHLPQGKNLTVNIITHHRKFVAQFLVTAPSRAPAIGRAVAGNEPAHEVVLIARLSESLSGQGQKPCISVQLPRSARDLERNILRIARQQDILRHCSKAVRTDFGTTLSCPQHEHFSELLQTATARPDMFENKIALLMAQTNSWLPHQDPFHPAHRQAFRDDFNLHPGGVAPARRICAGTGQPSFVRPQGLLLHKDDEHNIPADALPIPFRCNPIRQTPTSIQPPLSSNRQRQPAQHRVTSNLHHAEAGASAQRTTTTISTKDGTQSSSPRTHAGETDGTRTSGHATSTTRPVLIRNQPKAAPRTEGRGARLIRIITEKKRRDQHQGTVGDPMSESPTSEDAIMAVPDPGSDDEDYTFSDSTTATDITPDDSSSATDVTPSASSSSGTDDGNDFDHDGVTPQNRLRLAYATVFSDEGTFNTMAYFPKDSRCFSGCSRATDAPRIDPDAAEHNVLYALFEGARGETNWDLAIATADRAASAAAHKPEDDHCSPRNAATSRESDLERTFPQGEARTRNQPDCRSSHNDGFHARARIRHQRRLADTIRQSALIAAFYQQQARSTRAEICQAVIRLIHAVSPARENNRPQPHLISEAMAGLRASMATLRRQFPTDDREDRHITAMFDNMAETSTICVTDWIRANHRAATAPTPQDACRAAASTTPTAPSPASAAAILAVAICAIGIGLSHVIT